MSLAHTIEEYLEWSKQPRTPEEFERRNTARVGLEDALADLTDLDGVPVAEWVADAVATLRRVRDLI